MKKRRCKYILLVRYHPFENWQTASAEIFDSFKEAKKKALKIFVEKMTMDPRFIIVKSNIIPFSFTERDYKEYKYGKVLESSEDNL